MRWMDQEKQRRDQGVTRPLTQSQHEAINAVYPGLTLERCADCDEPTGRCEEDDMYCPDCDAGPLCGGCYQWHMQEHGYDFEEECGF